MEGSRTTGMTMVWNDSTSLESASLDADIIEVALLLPRWQVAALESVARKRGMSTGQMLRRMIGATVGMQPPSALS